MSSFDAADAFGILIERHEQTERALAISEDRVRRIGNIVRDARRQHATAPMSADGFESVLNRIGDVAGV
jgi:hypothetical protein